jgi:hypothetical protein
MRKLLALVASLSALVIFAVPASAETVLNQTMSAQFTAPGPCPPFESIAVSFTGHEVLHVTIDTTRAFHVGDDFNFQDTKGVGLVTGAQYVGAGGDWFNFNGQLGSAPQVFNDVFVMNIIAQGSLPNFKAHGLLHVTVNPDGTITSSIDNFSFACQS